MSVPFTQERKVLPCGCVSAKILDVFPYFRFIKYCEAHAKEHGKEDNAETAFIDTSPKYEATEGDVERVANYLLSGQIGNTYQISEALGMKGISVALAINELLKRGVVDVTPDNPHKYFFKP